MWAPATGRDRGVMFRTTPSAMARSAGYGACRWPYIDSPDWEPQQ
jgi:hypothetical protein